MSDPVRHWLRSTIGTVTTIRTFDLVTHEMSTARYLVAGVEDDGRIVSVPDPENEEASDG